MKVYSPKNVTYNSVCTPYNGNGDGNMELKLKEFVIKLGDGTETMRVRFNMSDEKISVCSNYSFDTTFPKTVFCETLRECLGEIDTAESLQKLINTRIKDSGVYISFEES